MPPRIHFGKRKKVRGLARSRGICIGCGTCADICPADCIAMVDHKPEVRYPEECFHCGACLVECPQHAITYRIPIPMLIPIYARDFFE
jgi:adenylylsulfate reductase subunit B